MDEPVAITGLGVACALGTDRETVARACRAGVRPFAPVRRFDASSFPVNLAAEVPSIDFAARFGRRAVRNTSRCDRLAMWAADDALTQAGLRDSEALRAAGIFVGASSGGMAEMEAVLSNGPRARLPLSTVWSYPVWATARRLARTFAIGGPQATYMTACSSAAHALGIAMHRLRRGDLDVALVGGTEAINRLTLAGFGSLGVLDPDGTRPFAEQRRGITLGEGAAFFLLERAEHARRRDTRIYALLTGYGAAADAHHMIHPREDGAGALAAMRAGLADAGLAAADIDYVNAHGTGTLQNDAMEARAIVELMTGHAPRVSSSKSMLGHTLGAAAALEGALTVLGMVGGFAPPNPGVIARDAMAGLGDCELVSAPDDDQISRPPPEVALSTSFAFGGNNAALVFESAERLAEAADRLCVRRRLTERRSVYICGAALTCDAGAATDAGTLAALVDNPRATTRSLPSSPLNHRDFLDPRASRRMDALSATATATAVLAARGAGFTTESAAQLGIGFGTSFGALDATARFLARLFAKGPTLVNPLEFPNLVHNAAAGYTSIQLGATGPNVTACQEELAGDEAVAVISEAIATGGLARAVCGGGDLASESLDRGYATVARFFDLLPEHQTVIGMLALEAAPDCERRGHAPWAELLASVGTGDTGLAGAIEAAVRRADLPVDRRIDLWLNGATSATQERTAVAAGSLPCVSDVRRIEARSLLGNAGGAGVAVIAVGAALVRTGRARTVLVTSMTHDGCAHATLLGAPRIVPADNAISNQPATDP